MTVGIDWSPCFPQVLRSKCKPQKKVMKQLGYAVGRSPPVVITTLSLSVGAGCARGRGICTQLRSGEKPWGAHDKYCRRDPDNLQKYLFSGSVCYARVSSSTDSSPSTGQELCAGKSRSILEECGLTESPWCRWGDLCACEPQGPVLIFVTQTPECFRLFLILLWWKGKAAWWHRW